jgi:hypothetical protein
VNVAQTPQCLPKSEQVVRSSYLQTGEGNHLFRHMNSSFKLLKNFRQAPSTHELHHNLEA